MALADKETKSKVKDYLDAFGEIGELPHHKINILDTYSEGVLELQEYAKEMDEVVYFVGFGDQNVDNKNQVTYLNVVKLEDNSISSISDIVKKKLETGRLKSPHIIYGEIDPKTKGSPEYSADDLAEIVAISKALGTEFGALVDVSAQKVSGGSVNYIRYNDTDKGGIGFFGTCKRENIHFLGGSTFGK